MQAQTLTEVVVVGMAVLIPRQTTATTIVVAVVNQAEVPPGDLHLAQARATQTFEAIGVTLRWETERPEAYVAAGNEFRIRLLLLSGAQADRMLSAQQVGDDVLGLAVSPARVAYVFCNRILSAVANRGMNFFAVLGRVIAHELGHVVLPSLTRHADVGIMRADMLVRSDRPEFFSDAQGALIRKMVSTARGEVAVR